MTKTQQLIALCEAATPGPWWSGKCEPTADGHALAWIGIHFVDCEGGQKNYKEQADDAAFIAACNPAEIKRMVEVMLVMREALSFYMTPPIGQLNDHHIEAAKRGVAAIAAFDEFNNDRVEGRDAASSRRVPSHDGLAGNVTTKKGL